jgi:hypothetical protein
MKHGGTSYTRKRGTVGPTALGVLAVVIMASAGLTATAYAQGYDLRVPGRTGASSQRR